MNIQHQEKPFTEIYGFYTHKYKYTCRTMHDNTCQINVLPKYLFEKLSRLKR